MARLIESERNLRHVECHRLSASGLGVKAIGRSLGLDPKSVRLYLAKPLAESLPLDTVPRSEVLASLVGLKVRYPQRGASQLRAMLLREYPAASVPCESSLDNHLRELGLTRQAKRFGQGGRPYWTQARPSQPLDLFQTDTVKFTTTSGMTVEYLTIKDVVSGFAFAARIPNWQSETLVSIWARAFAVMGVPRAVQCDNGLGFVLPRRLTLGRLQSYWFGRGVKQVIYIPEAEPQRNGSIESWHRWLKSEWWHSNAGIAVEPEIDAWLSGRVQYYNEVKPHLALGGKGSRLTPSDVHPAGDGELVYDAAGTGIVSWVRLVLSSGFAVIKNPAIVLVVGRNLGGRYVRIDYDYTTGGGAVCAHPAAAPGTDSLVERGRITGAVPDPVRVSTFSQLGPVVRLADESGLSALSLDDEAVLATWRKVLKQAAPSFVPSGFRLEQSESGWRLVDQSGCDLLTDESGAAYLEHADELLG
ncbi:transposase family protein [bacterium]|nr:transposase family protein [bacterium]